jgi:hypothetical protein
MDCGFLRFLGCCGMLEFGRDELESMVWTIVVIYQYGQELDIARLSLHKGRRRGAQMHNYIHVIKSPASHTALRD